MKKEIKRLFTGAGALAICSLIGKLLGALYRIPLTNVVGSEGMGLYQMVFPLYTLLLTVSSGGLPVAISRLVAVRMGTGDNEGAKKVLKVSVIALSIIGAIGSVALSLTGGLIARIQGNPSATLAYFGIAPSVFFVAVLSCLRGYFQGRENMLPTAVSQLLEQAVKLFFGLAFAKLLMRRGVEYAVFGSLLGVSLSELIATFSLGAYYLFARRKEERNAFYKRKRRYAFESREDAKFGSLSTSPKVKSTTAFEMGADLTVGLTGLPNGMQESCVRCVRDRDNNAWAILKSIVKVALPVTFGSLVLPLTQVIDSVLIINMLSVFGYDRTSATGAYGLLSGTVTTLINMPTVVVFALSSALLPKIAKVCGETAWVKKEAGFSYKLCMAMGLLASLFFFVYARPLMDILYAKGLSAPQRALASSLLRLSAISVFFVSVLQVSTSILQGLNKPKLPAKNLLFGALIKIALTATLLPLLGIYGAGIGTVSCYALTALIDCISVKKEIGVLFPRSRTSALAVGAVGFLAVAIFSIKAFTSVYLLLLSVIVSAVAYILLILLFGWLDREELRRFLPFFK